MRRFNPIKTLFSFYAANSKQEVLK